MFGSDPFETARQRMLVDHLQKRGITSPNVLAAMAKVPRERFAPLAEPEDVYADRALPIECGQTISQPYIVGLMTQALELTGSERVLEIGTGSGYQAAILAELAAEVISVERHAELSENAGQILRKLDYPHLQLVVGDGTRGWPPGAPYDRIIVTAASAEVPSALRDQLADPGILIIPLGDADRQMLQSIRASGGQQRVTNLSGCRFVPLIGAGGWRE